MTTTTDEWVEKVLADAPELSDEKRDHITELLGLNGEQQIDPVEEYRRREERRLEKIRRNREALAPSIAELTEEEQADHIGQAVYLDNLAQYVLGKIHIELGPQGRRTHTATLTDIGTGQNLPRTYPLTDVFTGKDQ